MIDERFREEEAAPGSDQEAESRAVQAGALPSALRRWRPHDFQRLRLLSETQSRTMEALHRKFARQAAEALSVLVRSKVEVTLLGVAQRSFSEFIHSLPNPTSLHLVYCQPRGLSMVLEIGPGMVFAALERLLGSKGDEGLQPVRPFTRLEQVLADMVAERLLEALRETWSATGEEFRFELAEPEHNPLLMQVVGPSEPSIVLAFQVALGLTSARAHICLPSRSFADVIEALARPTTWGPHSKASSNGERTRILERLSGVEVEFTAEMAPVPVAIGDMLALRPGDVIDTQLQVQSEVSFRLEGEEVFRGLPLLHEGRRALKIVRAEPEA